MKNLKFTFAVDGNHFMYTSLSALGGFSKKKQFFLKGASEEDIRLDKNAFFEKLSLIFAKDVRNLNVLVDDIIILLDDSRSWRKDQQEYRDYVGLPSKLSYKGTRKKDKEIDWTLIFETFQEFVDGLCKASNSKVKSITGCEADDLMFAISSYYNSQGKNVLIYSGDNDLKQCVGMDESTGAFTMQYQKQQKTVCVDRATGKFLKKNNNNTFVNCIKSFVNSAECKFLLVNPYDVIFDKVLIGDKGDNVLPVAYEIKKYKTGKKEGQEYESKVGEGTVKKIKEEINYENYNIEDFFVDEFILKLANSVIRNFKSDTKFNVKDIANNIKLNVTLVLLHHNCIPSALYDCMLEWTEDMHSKFYITDTKKIKYDKGILEHIKTYDKQDMDNTSSASIFKQLGL